MSGTCCANCYCKDCINKKKESIKEFNIIRHEITRIRPNFVPTPLSKLYSEFDQEPRSIQPNMVNKAEHGYYFLPSNKYKLKFKTIMK
jgi:hypothetical protein